MLGKSQGADASYEDFLAEAAMIGSYADSMLGLLSCSLSAVAGIVAHGWARLRARSGSSIGAASPWWWS